MHYSVPFYMGNRISGLDVPQPHILIDPDLEAGTDMNRMAELSPLVADAVASDAMPVIYAGDCCIILPVIAGLQRRGVDPVLVFYDAHGDFNTWETTESNFIGGMPLAMATGRGEMTIAAGCNMRTLPDTDTLLVDGRDLDQEEAVLLSDSDVMRIANESIVDSVPDNRPLYVHVDVDVVDPPDMPAVNYVAPDGPSVEAVAESVRGLAATGRVVAFSFSTWNPALDGAELSAANSHRIAAPFLSMTT